jgi:hypothetical protein
MLKEFNKADKATNCGYNKFLIMVLKKGIEKKYVQCQAEDWSKWIRLAMCG